MELDSLRAFVEVVNSGSLSRAAATMHLTQPALSRRIQQLETALAVRLFRRTGRGMTPTDAGLQLAGRARTLLAEFDRLGDGLATAETEARGIVRIGFPPSFGNSSTVDLFERFVRRHRRVELRLTVALSGAVTEGLQRQELDLGVLYSAVRTTRLKTEPLHREALWLVGPRAAKLSSSRPLRFRDVAAYPLILPTPRHGLRSLVESAAAQHGLSIQVVLEVDSLRLMTDFVARGVGFSLLPIETISAELATRRLTATPVRRPTLRRQALLGWASHTLPSAATRMLAAEIKELFGSRSPQTGQTA